MSALIEIKWHGKRFPIEFNSIDDLKRTTVKELKTYCSQMTGIEPDRIKLLVFGGSVKCTLFVYMKHSSILIHCN